MKIPEDAHLDIKQIKQPTLLLWGDKDLLVPIDIAHRFHKDLDNSTLTILKNVGHVPMEESPEESLDQIWNFLKKD